MCCLPGPDLSLTQALQEPWNSPLRRRFHWPLHCLLPSARLVSAQAFSLCSSRVLSRIFTYTHRESSHGVRVKAGVILIHNLAAFSPIYWFKYYISYIWGYLVYFISQSFNSRLQSVFLWNCLKVSFKTPTLHTYKPMCSEQLLDVNKTTLRGTELWHSLGDKLMQT